MKVPKHIKSRMIADAINQLPILPKGTKEREQIKKVSRKLETVYENLD